MANKDEQRGAGTAAKTGTKITVKAAPASRNRKVVVRQGPARRSAPEVPAELLKKFGLEALHADHVAASAVPEQMPAAAVTGGQTTAASSSSGAESPLLDDAQTGAAVDDIMAKEGDELLGIGRAGSVGESGQPPQRRGFWRRLGRPFAWWWHKKWVRWTTLLLIFAGIAATALLPAPRYAVLNAAGVRARLSLTVLDNTTQLPLANVGVTLGAQRATTNKQGVANFANVRLGPQQLTIQRLAFATVHQRVVVGWGSNPLGSFALRAVGLQYAFQLDDYFSGKPVAGAEATTTGGLTAQSDMSGRLVLTLGAVSGAELPVTLSANGYLSQTVLLHAAQSAVVPVKLVPAGADVFVSNQTGVYSVYRSDLDGQNRRELLAGTGRENIRTMSLSVSPDGALAAYVSTRDGAHDADGYPLSGLTIIDLNSGAVSTIDHAEQIALVDWTGGRLVYETISAGGSAANGQRAKLVSYNYQANNRTQLAAANQFTVAASAQGRVYFAASRTDPNAPQGLFAIKPDGTGKQQVFGSEVWSAVRTDYGAFALQTPQGWFNYVVGGAAQKAAEPALAAPRQYALSPDGQHAAWNDQRDGRGVLLVRDISTGRDTSVTTQAGLTYPVRWAGNGVIVYRVAGASETADYAVSAAGGPAKKIADVSNAAAFTQAY